MYVLAELVREVPSLDLVWYVQTHLITNFHTQRKYFKVEGCDWKCFIKIHFLFSSSSWCNLDR